MSLDSNSISTSRFSLILLEPNEIYFEDYLVYYNETTNPLENAAIDVSKQAKGNLKICSKSIVFDPLNIALPIVKFPFKSIDKIVTFDIENDEMNKEEELDLNDIYSTKKTKGTKTPNDELRKKCFALSSKLMIKCKENNTTGPFKIIKRDSKQEPALFYFQFIFTNVNDSMDLLLQLHRASTLDYEHEELMLQMILKSRLARDTKFDLAHLDDVIREQIQFEAIVNKINPLVSNPGRIILTNMCLYYKPFNNLENEVIKIKLKQIKYVIKRRYHLKRVGCEIIFDKSKLAKDESEQQSSSSVYTNSSKTLPFLYLAFEEESIRDSFYNRLVNDHRDKLINLDECSQENMLQKWRYGAISNYEYLMHLNNIADRSYNDLTQYPVFPWVLVDYESDTLDLNDPNVFRDLSKPIGALNEPRLARFKQRFKEMNAPTTKLDRTEAKQERSFLYGSHYSTPAFVLFYLVRKHPEWQLCLQNGRFDHPNRLFHSISDTWRNCLHTDSDVKELIPEFYDTNDSDEIGSFLRNYHELDLGLRDDGNRVNDVVLPKWAHGSPREFILKMREALESQVVSEKLHKWIDLIFGYKQRGDEALKADNLFYYLCYEGSIDLDSIKDYSERKSLETQIQEFGQIPIQLFKSPHLAKEKFDLLNETRRLSLSDQLQLQQQQQQQQPPKSKETEEYKNETLNQVITKQTRSNSTSSDKNRINPMNFGDLKVFFNSKIHKSQINDCLFIEKIDGFVKNSNFPFVCSVSNDNWLKIYSLEDRSLIRSHKVCDFSISSVDFVQLLTNDSIGDTEHEGADFWSNQSARGTTDMNEHRSSQTTVSRTFLFLSCWNNSIHIYDINYNRCINTLKNVHDDAISRIRLISSSNSLQNQTTSVLLVTSSWDSSIKIWRCNNLNYQNLDTIKLEGLNELSHDSAVIDFELSESYLASLCNDGSLHLWKLNKMRHEQGLESVLNNQELDSNFYDFDYEELYELAFNLNSVNELGKINDCKIHESVGNDLNSISTISICTSLGYIKIYNLQNRYELFSLRINAPSFSLISSDQQANNQGTQLNKLFYNQNYMITIDSNGFVYFIDTQSQMNKSNNATSSTTSLTMSSPTFAEKSKESSSFLTHKLYLGNNNQSSTCLKCLNVYNDSIVCVGDSDGNIFFLSLT